MVLSIIQLLALIALMLIALIMMGLMLFMVVVGFREIRVKEVIQCGDHILIFFRDHRRLALKSSGKDDFLTKACLTKMRKKSSEILFQLESDDTGQLKRVGLNMVSSQAKSYLGTAVEFARGNSSIPESRAIMMLLESCKSLD